MKPKISIVIATTGDNFFIANLLRSLRKQEIEKTSVEVLLVVNNSQPAFVKFAKSSDLNLKVHNLDEKNVGRARNRGLSLAEADVVYFLDDDCVLPSPTHLQNILNLHTQNENICAIGGGYLNHQRTCFLGEIYNGIVNVWLTQNSSGNKLLPGGNLSLKKSLLHNIRFLEFKEQGGEESHLLHGLHLMNAGVLVCRELDIYHLPQMSLLKFFKRPLTHGRAKALQKIERKPTRHISNFLNWAMHSMRPAHLPFIVLYFILDQMGFFYQRLQRTSL